MDARAEQLVLDYLRRLEDAAGRALEPDELRAFMSRSRAAIARQIGETRAAEVGDVQRLVRRYGDPRKLATRERRRLDASAKPDGGPRLPQDSPAGQRPEAPAAARAQRPVTATPGRGPSAAPTLRRPSAAPPLRRPPPARWRSGAELAAAPRSVAPALRNLTGWPGFPRWTSSAPRAGASSPDPLPPGSSGPAAGASPASAGPDPPHPAGRGARSSWPSGVFDLARRHPLECGAMLLLGVGGLIAPFPLWPLGALAVLISRQWDARDKLVAVAVPVAVAFPAAIALAGLTAKAGSLSGYVHGVWADGWNLVRIGAVLGAIYLARRVWQGPRSVRQPPWRRAW